MKTDYQKLYLLNKTKRMIDHEGQSELVEKKTQAFVNSKFKIICHVI